MATLQPADPALGIVKADALEFLRSLPTASVDCIFTDPPYSSIDKHRYGGDGHRRMTELFPTITMQQIEAGYYADLLQQFTRVLRDNRHCYIMADEETMDLIKQLELDTDKEGSIFDVGDKFFDGGEFGRLRFWKSVIWDKCTRGMGYHYANRHEFVLFFEKGKRKLNDPRIESIVTVKKLRGISEDGSEGYPTQKPVKLVEVFLQNSCAEGFTVLDCFAGSGSTGKAALRNNYNFIGCDLFSGTVEFK